jgi:tetratricopeptide (TPR) repeat protein
VPAPDHRYDRDRAARKTTEPEDALFAPDEGELPFVLVPVSEDDHVKRKRRMIFAIVGLVIAAAAFAGWEYKQKTDPLRALEAFDAGERYLRQARYQQAIVSFDRAISYKNDYSDAFLMRGRANLSLGKPLIAIPDFTKVTDLRPRDPIALLDRGQAHMALHEYPEALSDFTRAVELDPKLDTAYNLRGTAVRAMGDPKIALEDFDRAVELRGSMSNYLQRGATYQLLGDHEFAIADFSRVISFEPASAEAYYSRAQSFKALGDLESAARDHAKGRKLDGH